MYPISYVSYITSYLLLAGCTRWGKQFGRNGRSVTLSSSKSPNTLSPSAGDFIVIVIVIVIVISPRPSLPIHFCHLQVISYFATFATFCHFIKFQFFFHFAFCSGSSLIIHIFSFKEKKSDPQDMLQLDGYTVDYIEPAGGKSYLRYTIDPIF